MIRFNDSGNRAKLQPFFNLPLDGQWQLDLVLYKRDAKDRLEVHVEKNDIGDTWWICHHKEVTFINSFEHDETLAELGEGTYYMGVEYDE
jgi:hypothetical protein